jgi:hypothetical protein
MEGGRLLLQHQQQGVDAAVDYGAVETMAESASVGAPAAPLTPPVAPEGDGDGGSTGGGAGRTSSSCGLNCAAWVGWRHSSLDNRRLWKAACSTLLLIEGAWYFSLVTDSAVLIFMGAFLLVKLLVEIWGQHTPT